MSSGHRETSLGDRERRKVMGCIAGWAGSAVI